MNPDPSDHRADHTGRRDENSESSNAGADSVLRDGERTSVQTQIRFPLLCLRTLGGRLEWQSMLQCVSLLRAQSGRFDLATLVHAAN